MVTPQGFHLVSNLQLGVNFCREHDHVARGREGWNETKKMLFFLAAWPPVCLATLSSLKKIEPLGLFAGILLLSTLVESMHTMRIIIVSCWELLLTQAMFLSKKFWCGLQHARHQIPPTSHLMYFATKTSLAVTSIAGWTANRIISKNYRRCREGCHHDIGERGS